MSRDPEAWNRRDPDYRRGYQQGRAARRAARNNSGCAVFLLALAPTLVAVAGWAGGVLFGWWSA